MAGFNNSLFPPIIDTYMPAFIIAEKEGICRVYFSLSKYNSLSDIKTVWVIINNQYTNASVLNTKTGLKAYKMPDIDDEALKLDSVKVDEERVGDDKYYIEINASDLEGGDWISNQAYKVQLRFLNKLPEVGNNEIEMNWIVTNEKNFSEWSTVCLIKGILQPELFLKNFQDSATGIQTIFTSLNNHIVGQVLFNDNEELESYQIQLYNEDNLLEILFDSGIVYTDSFNPNEINYFLKYAFVNGNKYLMKFTYITRNSYKETIEYSFSVIDSGGEFLNATISAKQDEEDGSITLYIKGKDESPFAGNITIRRSSSESNFAIWEDIHTTTIFSNDPLDFIWKDYTVESGIWYKYCVQKRSNKGDRGLIVPIEKPVMVTLQDMFLTRADKQLKIKFNPQISSYKRTVSDSMTQTLGSKYPFVKRNGNVNFKQFSISGLISHFMDENKVFLSEEDLYLKGKDLYLEYNEKNKINKYNDFTLERTFRESVLDFLYNNDVKLFRSPSEGNILIKLMDISLTPQTTLGRMIYTFNATAYEIDEINFENFDKYGIQKVGEYSSLVTGVIQKQSQYKGLFSGDFIEYLQKQEESVTSKDMKSIISHIDSLYIEMQSKPYLINNKLGYSIKINGQDIFINSNGRYSISLEDQVEIISLTFPKEVDVLIDYSVQIKQEENTELIPKQIYYTSKVGQIWGNFRPDQNIINWIKSKYNIQNKEDYQEVFTINTIKLESSPKTVCYIQDISNSKYKKYILGDSGYLNLESEDFSITGLYFYGMYLNKNTDKFIRDDEYILTNEKVLNISEIINPIKNGVYKVENLDGIETYAEINENTYMDKVAKVENQKNVIFYKNKWYLFDKEDSCVIKSNDGLVDYYYELEKGEF